MCHWIGGGFFVVFWRIGLTTLFLWGAFEVSKFLTFFKGGRRWVPTCTKYSEASVPILIGTMPSFGSSNIVLECMLLLINYYLLLSLLLLLLFEPYMYYCILSLVCLCIYTLNLDVGNL